MQVLKIVSTLVCFICVISVNADSADNNNRRGNGLSFGGISRDSLTWRLADFIRSQARFPIRSFSTEDYTDDEDGNLPPIKPVPKKKSGKQSPNKPRSGKTAKPNTLEFDLQPTQVKFQKPSKSKKFTEKQRW